MIALLLAIGLALAGPVEDGDQAFEAGDYPSALVSWGDALKAAAPEERLPLLLRMAAAQRELGAVDLAARVLDEAEKLAKDPRSKADLAVDRGRLAQHQGDLAGAEAAYKKAFGLYQGAGDPRGGANAALNLGTARILLGRVDEADKAFAGAKTLYASLGDARGQADADVNLALVARQRGRLREARDMLDGALKRYQAAGDQAGQVDVHGNLARIEAELGRPAATTRHVDAALALARERKDVNRQLDLLRDSATLWLELGDPVQAVQRLDAVAAGYQKQGRARDAVDVQLDRANLATTTGVRKALGGKAPDDATWARLVDAAESSGDPRLAARAHIGRARAATGRGDHASARKEATKALKIADRVGSDEVRWQALYVLGRAAQVDGDLDAAARSLTEAVDVLDRRRRLLDGQADAAWVELYDPVYSALADVHLAQGNTLSLLATANRQAAADLPVGDGAAPAAELARQEAWLQDRLGEEVASHGDSARATALRTELAELRVAFADTVDRLRTDVDDLDSRVRIAPEDLEALQSELPEGVVVLQPVLLPDRLVLLVFSRDVLEAVPVEVSPGEVESTLSRLTRALRAGMRDRALLDPLADRLGGWLWAPVAGRLAAADTVVVATAGPLRQLPFALLRHDGHYLAEKAAVATISHVGSLRGASSPLRVEGRSLLLVGNPDGSLPGAEAEVRALAARFDGSAVLVGQQATRDAVLGSLDGRTTVHLATHGRIDSAAPARSYLVLADGSGSEAHLGYREIPGLAPYLSGARMVVLSACESGRPVQARESDVVSIQGLSAQFRRAGVETLVASLWKVDDTGTQALMERFYGHLAQGHDAATALAEAQRELIADEALGSPWVWAAFVVAGDWR